MVRRLNWIKSILAVLLLIGLVFSHLALTDISHGTEPDLQAEWWTVRITFLMAAALAVTSILTTRHVILSVAPEVQE